MPAKKPLKERFEAKFTKGDSDKCWKWQASCNPKTGYGQIMTGDAKSGFKPELAHRLSYMFYVGPIPEGLTIDHECKNRKCVNPNHLTPLPNVEHVIKDHRNINKTHCQNGHEFNQDNTYIVKQTGHRQCKICRKELQKKFKKENPSYKKEYWAKNIEENRQKQREYLQKRNKLLQSNIPVSS